MQFFGRQSGQDYSQRDKLEILEAKYQEAAFKKIFTMLQSYKGDQAMPAIRIKLISIYGSIHLFEQAKELLSSIPTVELEGDLKRIVQFSLA